VGLDGGGGASPRTGIDRPAGRRRSDRIVGGGRATQAALDRALSAARSARPVWIVGPPGSGKEHFARAIHAWSSRAGDPFVVVACDAGAAPREIFGSAGGHRSEASEPHEGALARAARGSLLLDGIERASGDLRAALAQAIRDERYRREGSSEILALHARVIVTSLEPLDPAPLGALACDRIDLSPLSERREDVLPLAAHFLRLAADEEGVAPVGFTSDARDALLAEPWPGNVRELAARVRQAVKLAGNGAISAEALLLAADGEVVPSFKEAKRAFETRYVVGLLRRCGGNISHAARLAKKDRKDFYDVIRRTGIDPSEFR
jgi:two-component system response regulator GlrR